MSDPESHRSLRERQVDTLIAEYYQSVERGDPLDQDGFLAAHPDFAVDLREFFADIGQMGDLVRPAAPDLGETQIQSPSEAPDFAPGTVIRYFGEYELLEQVGMGGMGVVYKARQSKLKRIVALKLIKSGALANPNDLQRFQVEARAAARLSHPGIVPVHEVGVFQDQHFYTMEYVAGGSLSRLYRDGPVASRRAADLVQQLALAMHYAHQNGIVHRDLKPANVLLTAEGQPRITDFGLAKLIQPEDETHEATLTETGQILGTAGYMSPEQAAGKTRLVGPPTDIYALGAVLYALLTSRAPFVGETVPHTLMQVLHKEPVSPNAGNDFRCGKKS
jgi:eukaryotic-like serine/threonine-protein kinase